MGYHNMYKTWSQEEKDFISSNADKMTDKKLTEALNATFNTNRLQPSVRKMRQRLKVKKAHGRGICHVTERTSDDLDNNGGKR